MTTDYVYDPEFAEERARLAGMEALWDPGTFALLDELDVAPGMSCLELGAGAGSVAAWLAERVGPTGHVVAADLETRYVEQLASEVLEVRRLDLRADSLPEAEFDVVHARLLLEHLTDRHEILLRMADALKPGGVLVVEDYDWTAFGFLDSDFDFATVTDAVLGFMAAAGFDPVYGRRLPGELTSAGLTGVRGEGRSRVIAGDSPGAAFFRLSFESLKDAVVSSGHLSAELADQASERIADPAVSVLTPTMMAGIGRRA
jgi:SAM-dependent methyltransferase